MCSSTLSAKYRHMQGKKQSVPMNEEWDQIHSSFIWHLVFCDITENRKTDSIHRKATQIYLIYGQMLMILGKIQKEVQKKGQRYGKNQDTEY